MPMPYGIEDPVTQDLARFLNNTPLSNGAFAPIPAGLTPLVAQAVLNYSIGLAWDEQGSRYITVRELRRMPEGYDIEYEEVASGVHKLSHRPTGEYVIDTDQDKAWSELRKKVISHAE